MAERPDSPIPSVAEIIDRMNFLSDPPIPHRVPDRAGWIPAPDWRNDPMKIDDPPEDERTPAYPELLPQPLAPKRRREHDAQENGTRRGEAQIPINPAILPDERPSQRRDNGHGAYIQYPRLRIHVERERDQPQRSEPSTVSPLSQDTSDGNGVPVIGPTLQAVIDVGQKAQARRPNLRRRDGIAPLRAVNAGDGDQLSEDRNYVPRGATGGGYVPYRPPQEPLPKAGGRLSGPLELPQEFVPPATIYPGKPALRGRAPQSEPRDGQTPVLPPMFQHMLIDYIQKGKHDIKALQWYLDDMTAADASGRVGGHDHEDLEDILHSHSRIHLTSRSVPGRWRPVRQLGLGDYGSVVLWEKDNNDRTKTLRVACKYGRLDKWFRDYCHEGQLARKLVSVGCTNVVKPFDWAARPDAHDHEQMKIIMEFCPYGDLYNLIHWYQRKRLIFPEFFVWHILLSVATALCYCARGSLEEKPKGDWHPIFHRDLKPLNILLGEPSEPIKAYPTLKLADFGLAYTIPNESVLQMKRRMGTGGTQGYIAPEAKLEIRSDPKQAFDAYAGPKSDIYSLGVMLIEILRMPKSHYPKGDAGWRLLDLEHDYSYNYYPYGKRLVWLARRCSRNNARERPEPLELYKEAKKGFQDAWAKYSREVEHIQLVPGEVATAGTVLYTPVLQYTWDHQPQFRQRFRTHNDWFYNHKPEMLRLAAAVDEPYLAPRGYVSIGNGLGPTIRVEDLPGNSKPAKLETDREYRFVTKHKHRPLQNIWRDQLQIEPLNLKWKKPGTKGTTAKKVQREIDALLFGTDLGEVMKTALREGQNRRKLKRAALREQWPPLPSQDMVDYERDLEEEAAKDLQIFKELAVQNRKVKGLQASSEATTVIMDTASKLSSALASFFIRSPPEAQNPNGKIREIPSATAHLDAALAVAEIQNGTGKRKRERMDLDGEDVEDPRIREFWDKRRKKFHARQEKNARRDGGQANGNGNRNSSYERKRQKLQERRLEERESQKERQRREKKARPQGNMWTGWGVLEKIKKFQDQL